MQAGELHVLFEALDRMFLPRPVSRYIARLVAATHAAGKEAVPLVKSYVTHGASPRPPSPWPRPAGLSPSSPAGPPSASRTSRPWPPPSSTIV